MSAPLSRRSSTETQAGAVDLDLEKQLQELSQEQESGSVSTKEALATSSLPVGPATLAHDDPENPRLWSTRKKVIINIVLNVWVLALTYSSTAYIASIPDLIARFGMGHEIAILGVTLTVLGFSAGPLLAGPSSEVFGRRTVFLVSGLGFSAFSWGASEANSTNALLACRFFVGFFGSASINNVPASIGDFTYPHNRNRYSIVYAALAFGGPALGPLASAFLVPLGSNWNFRVMAIFVTLTSLAVAFVPETHGPTLHKRKVKKNGTAPPAPGWRHVAGVYGTAMQRPLQFLFKEIIVTLISLYLSTLYGILYGFFTAFAVVYEDRRGFTAQQYGLTYIALGVGFLIGAILLATVGDFLYLSFAKRAAPAPTPPEARLGLAYVGAIVSPISLFMFAFSAPALSVHWIVPCIAEALFSASMLLIFTAFIPYLIDVYTVYAASALAAGMASRALIGSMFPLFALDMYRVLSIVGATALLGGLSVILAPIPFFFAKYGATLRARSPFAQK